MSDGQILNFYFHALISSCSSVSFQMLYTDCQGIHLNCGRQNWTPSLDNSFILTPGQYHQKISTLDTDIGMHPSLMYYCFHVNYRTNAKVTFGYSFSETEVIPAIEFIFSAFFMIFITIIVKLKQRKK